jgi:hypothetical protein
MSHYLVVRMTDSTMNQVLEMIGGRTRTRTLDPLIKSQLANFAVCASPQSV